MSGKPLPLDVKKMMQKALVRRSDLPGEMTGEVVDMVVGTIDKFSASGEPDLEGATKVVKDTMDKNYGANWHVVMGKGYSFDITSQSGTLLYIFYQGDLGILLFKC